MLWLREDKRDRWSDRWEQVGNGLRFVLFDPPQRFFEFCGELQRKWSAQARHDRAIQAAILADDVEAVRRRLKPKDSGARLSRLMCVAAYGGCPAVLRFLAARGTDPNENWLAWSYDDSLPLVQAVYGTVSEGERLAADPALLARRLETISALLACGADVNCGVGTAPDRVIWNGRLPLRVAVDYGCPKEVVDLLVNAGGRVRLPAAYLYQTSRLPGDGGEAGSPLPRDPVLPLPAEEARRELERYVAEGGPAVFAEARRLAAERESPVLYFRAQDDQGNEGRAYYGIYKRGERDERVSRVPLGVEWAEWVDSDGSTHRYLGTPA